MVDGEELRKAENTYRDKIIAEARAEAGEPLEATAPPTVVGGGTLDLRAQIG